MGKFTFTKTDIDGVVIVNQSIFGDERGYFMETYNKKDFEAAGIDVTFVQDNQSKSVKGVLRGLHFQTNHPQGKLVRVIKGKVYDVAVDIDPNSPTFGKYVGVVLSDENKTQLYIKPGMAHGFYVMSDEAEFTYKCTDFYDPTGEDGVMWNDEDIAIDWPIEEGVEVILSEKDQHHKHLKDLK